MSVKDQILFLMVTDILIAILIAYLFYTKE